MELVSAESIRVGIHAEAASLYGPRQLDYLRALARRCEGGEDARGASRDIDERGAHLRVVEGDQAYARGDNALLVLDAGDALALRVTRRNLRAKARS